MTAASPDFPSSSTCWHCEKQADGTFLVTLPTSQHDYQLKHTLTLCFTLNKFGVPLDNTGVPLDNTDAPLENTGGPFDNTGVSHDDT